MLGLHITGVVLAWVYLRRRIGAWAALAPALVLLVFGPATELLVYPVNVGFQLAIVCGIGALLLLDGAPGRRSALGACALLTVGVASSSVSIAFLIVAACTVLGPATRRSQWWVVGVPAAVYLIWTAAYGADELHWSNAKIAWQYSVEGLARTAGSLVALGPDWGRPLALGAAALVLWTIARAPRPPLRVIGLALGLVVFWALTAMARAQLGVPGSERFLYPSAVLLALLLGETLAATALPRRLAPVLAAVVVAVIVANGAQLHDQTLAIRDMGAAVSGGVAAVRLEPAATPDGFHPPVLVYGGTAGQLRNAVRLYGSLFPAPTEIERASLPARRSADDTLRAASAPLLRAAAPGAATARGCVDEGAGQADVDLPAGGLLVRPGVAPVEVRTRRFAPKFGAADGTVAVGATQRLVAAPGDGIARVARATVLRRAVFRLHAAALSAPPRASQRRPGAVCPPFVQRGGHVLDLRLGPALAGGFRC